MSKSTKKRLAEPEGPGNQTQEVHLDRLKIVHEGCQLLYGQIVNVASSQGGLSFTFYQAVPDPSVLNHKTTLLYARAIVQVPIEAGMQLPGFIISQALSRADIAEEELKYLIQESEKVTELFRKKLEEKIGKSSTT